MFSELINFHVLADRCVDENFDGTYSNRTTNCVQCMRDEILMEHLLGAQESVGGCAG